MSTGSIHIGEYENILCIELSHNPDSSDVDFW